VTCAGDTAVGTMASSALAIAVAQVIAHRRRSGFGARIDALGQLLKPSRARIGRQRRCGDEKSGEGTIVEREHAAKLRRPGGDRQATCWALETLSDLRRACALAIGALAAGGRAVAPSRALRRIEHRIRRRRRRRARESSRGSLAVQPRWQRRTNVWREVTSPGT